jgi:hypothetical protein
MTHKENSLELCAEWIALLHLYWLLKTEFSFVTNCIGSLFML